MKTKKNFKVLASWSIGGSKVIKADTEKEAKNIAYGMGIGEFDDDGYIDDSFQIESAEEWHND